MLFRSSVAHRVACLGLHAANVGDGRDVVVVKPVPESQHRSRQQRESQISRNKIAGEKTARNEMEGIDHRRNSAPVL